MFLFYVCMPTLRSYTSRLLRLVFHSYNWIFQTPMISQHNRKLKLSLLNTWHRASNVKSLLECLQFCLKYSSRCCFHMQLLETAHTTSVYNSFASYLSNNLGQLLLVIILGQLLLIITNWCWLLYIIPLYMIWITHWADCY
jgi:hypothetical protein